jgi:negative regulator of sigma E activity
VSRAARSGLIAATLIVTAVIAQAASTGPELLRRSQQAERAHSYRGTRVSRMFFPRYSITAVAAVVHQRPATTRVEYRSPSSIEGTVVLQIGAQRWRRASGDRFWQRAAAPPEPEAFDLLTRNYDLRVDQGPQVVAQRDCSLLLINPRHKGNPSKRMWIDRGTGLVLRTELLNWKQQHISISAFRDIQIDPNLTDALPLLAPPRQAQIAPRRTVLGFQPSSPAYIPPGYVSTGTDVMTLGKFTAAHLHYTDGLNTISLFQAPGRAFANETPFGSMELSFTQVIMWRRGDMAFAIMGDIDPAELRKMADSITVPAIPRPR